MVVHYNFLHLRNASAMRSRYSFAGFDFGRLEQPP